MYKVYLSSNINFTKEVLLLRTDNLDKAKGFLELKMKELNPEMVYYRELHDLNQDRYVIYDIGLWSTFLKLSQEQ